jgi:hypothetical protein
MVLRLEAVIVAKVSSGHEALVLLEAGAVGVAGVGALAVKSVVRAGRLLERTVKLLLREASEDCGGRIRGRVDGVNVIHLVAGGAIRLIVHRVLFHCYATATGQVVR